MLPLCPGVNARIIAIANQKGGVGKTTTAVNLGASLAADGRRVLLFDIDPQGNASSGVGVPSSSVEHGVYDALIGEHALESVILTTVIEKLHLAPSNRDLAGAALELAELEDAHTRLKTVLGPMRARYQYIVIDCPPSLDLLTINALTAADSVLVPVQCEYYAMEGLAKLTSTIEGVRERLNPGLQIEGIVFTMFDPRNNLAHQVITEVKGHFVDNVFETIIPRNVRLSEAPSFGQPCLLYDLASRGSQSYIQLARELERRRRAA
jgi:chromosome partitioning protein